MQVLNDKTMRRWLLDWTPRVNRYEFFFNFYFDRRQQTYWQPLLIHQCIHISFLVILYWTLTELCICVSPLFSSKWHFPIPPFVLLISCIHISIYLFYAEIQIVLLTDVQGIVTRFEFWCLVEYTCFSLMQT